MEIATAIGDYMSEEEDEYLEKRALKRHQDLMNANKQPIPILGGCLDEKNVDSLRIYGIREDCIKILKILKDEISLKSEVNRLNNLYYSYLDKLNKLSIQNYKLKEKLNGRTTKTATKHRVQPKKRKLASKNASRAAKKNSRPPRRKK